MDKLVQLRQMTKVVADTADVEAVKRLKPMDCTTNPTIVLQALKTPIFHEDFEEALE
ncbi:transaldolase [Rhizobium leguminosarum]|nr:transaldolase [Rhizobium leguminosarum]MBB4435097.1 transaldolase [Rhizobium esperanzae]MBB4310981.1 transaldolase [Rhizobium leguminosarum]MBB4419907.1 transaldolase [Rhizobium leguminosarum]MBB4531971.1 transaldolase [Rhizobium leguminosarum]